jgi:hypothetical protein
MESLTRFAVEFLLHFCTWKIASNVSAIENPSKNQNVLSLCTTPPSLNVAFDVNFLENQISPMREPRKMMQSVGICKLWASCAKELS